MIFLLFYIFRQKIISKPKSENVIWEPCSAMFLPQVAKWEQLQQCQLVSHWRVGAIWKYANIWSELKFIATVTTSESVIIVDNRIDCLQWIWRRFKTPWDMWYDTVKDNHDKIFRYYILTDNHDQRQPSTTLTDTTDNILITTIMIRDNK